MKFRPTAWWRTRTWPGPGEGTARSTASSTSGPPVRTACMASIGSAQVGLEESQAAAVGLTRVGRVIVLAAHPSEGVVATRIGVDLDLRMLLQGVEDHLLSFLRDELVF